MSNTEEFAVSDETGKYVFYTNDFREAQKVVKEIDETLAEDDIEGRAAIMRRCADSEGYELYW